MQREWSHSHWLFRFWYRYTRIKTCERLGLEPPVPKPHLPEWDEWLWYHGRRKQLMVHARLTYEHFRLRFCFYWMRWHATRNIKMRQAWRFATQVCQKPYGPQVAELQAYPVLLSLHLSCSLVLTCPFVIIVSLRRPLTRQTKIRAMKQHGFEAFHDNAREMRAVRHLTHKIMKRWFVLTSHRLHLRRLSKQLIEITENISKRKVLASLRKHAKAVKVQAWLITLEPTLSKPGKGSGLYRCLVSCPP